MRGELAGKSNKRPCEKGMSRAASRYHMGTRGGATPFHELENAGGASVRERTMGSGPLEKRFWSIPKD